MEEYMEKNKLPYYTLRTDVIFKNTFNDEESLKRLLSETLNLEVKDILQSNIELPVEKYNERKKYLDLILETDIGIVNVELNHGYKDELPNRNLLYFCKLLSSSVKRNNSYINVDKHIQLNITWNLKKYLNFGITNKKIIPCHITVDETHEKLYENVFEIINVNMDYFEDVWYHGDVKKENPFLMLLAAPTEEKMDEISEGDNLMENINAKVKRLNQDTEILDVIIENEDEIIANSMYEKGVQNGISQGVSQERQNSKKEREKIVKNLLDRNMSIDDVIQITNLTKEEVEKISKK